MITYEKLWQTMKERNITTYHLITYHNISRGLISRLKKGEAMTTNTLNNLCNILDCDVTDILTYTKDTPMDQEEQTTQQ